MAANSFLWLAFLAFAAALSLQDIGSFDYWWHLRTGALIAEIGEIPRVDPYTYTVPGARWLDIHWLFQLGLHGLHRLGGHAAVVWAQVAWVAALLALLAPIGYRRTRPWITLAGLLALLVVASDRIAPRPELPTFVLLAAVIALLDRFERRGDRWVYAIVPIQLLWVNLHGLFALGIAVCGAHWLAELARPLGRPGEGLRRGRLAHLTAVTSLSILAAFANPNGSDGALYPLMQLGMIGPAESRGALGAMISELRPALVALKPVPLACFLTLAGASLAAMLLNWRRARVSDPLLWFSFLYLALGARRNVAVFAVVAAPMLARNLNEFLDARAWVPSPRARAVVAGLLALGFAALSVDVARGSFYGRLGRFQTTGLGVLEDHNPVGAVDWIARERPAGPIAHEMHDGGYLIWRLYPDYRVMSDGRLEVYGAETFARLSIRDPEHFRSLDREYRFGSVLLHTRAPVEALVSWLIENPGWCLAFLDDVAAVFLRTPGPGVCPVAEVDLEAADLFPPLDGREPRLDMGRTLSRAHFLAAAGHNERALAIMDEGLARHPELPHGEAIRAMLAQRAGALP